MSRDCLCLMLALLLSRCVAFRLGLHLSLYMNALIPFLQCDVHLRIIYMYISIEYVYMAINDDHLFLAVS